MTEEKEALRGDVSKHDFMANFWSLVFTLSHVHRLLDQDVRTDIERPGTPGQSDDIRRNRPKVVGLDVYDTHLYHVLGFKLSAVSTSVVWRVITSDTEHISDNLVVRYPHLSTDRGFFSPLAKDCLSLNRTSKHYQEDYSVHDAKRSYPRICMGQSTWFPFRYDILQGAVATRSPCQYIRRSLTRRRSIKSALHYQVSKVKELEIMEY